MKKVALIVALVLGFGMVAQAQTKIGIHGGFDVEGKNPIIGVNAEIGVMDKLTVAPDVGYLMLDKVEGVSSLGLEFNANGHYYFYDKDTFKFFGLAGVGYNYFKSSSEILGVKYEFSGGNFGVNVGAGMSYALSSNLDLFSTVKYTIRTGSSLGVHVGLRYTF